jgi:hypothetical protein
MGASVGCLAFRCSSNSNNPAATYQATVSLTPITEQLVVEDLTAGVQKPMYYTIERKPASRRRRVAAFVVPLQVLLLILWLLWSIGGAGAPVPTEPIPVATCLKYDGYLAAEPGDVLTVNASTEYKQCETRTQVQKLSDFDEFVEYNPQHRKEIDNYLAQAKTDEQYRDLLARYEKWKGDQRAIIKSVSAKAIIGDRARLSLVSPLFDGVIQPISQELQLIGGTEDKGTWTWQVRPDKPGDYSISLVLTILNPDGKTADYVNEPAMVFVHVDGTFSYYAGTVWQGASAFLTSLQGLVVGIVAAIAAVIGLAPKLRRKKKDLDRPTDAQLGQGGYL